MQPPARIRLRLNKNYQWTSTSSLFILVAIVLSRCCNDRVSIKDALKREKSKFQRGIGNAHTLKDLGKTFHELNKLAESVVKENFGALRKRPGQLLQDRLDDVLCFKEAWVAQRSQLFTVLVQKWSSVDDLLRPSHASWGLWSLEQGDSWSDKIWDRYTRFSDYNIFKPEKIILSLRPVPRLWWV